MKCHRCGREIRDGDSCTYLGETLCDDCYMDARFSAKACDPWAVYTATRTRETSGLNGAEGLTELQKAIYEFVKSKGKALTEEVIENFNISRDELESQFAVLRHCELVKGRKEGDRFYLVPFA
jgi:hypothetical protein